MVSCPATLITRSSAKVFRMPVLVPSVALTSHQDVSPQFDFRYEPVPARGNCYQAVARETDSPLGSRVTRVARGRPDQHHRDGHEDQPVGDGRAGDLVVTHHWASWAENQWVAPWENAARAPTISVHTIAYGKPAALTGLPVFGPRYTASAW